MESKGTALETLNAALKASVVQQHISSTERVVDEAAGKEVKEFASTLTKAFSKLKELKKAYKEIKPDTESVVSEQGEILRPAGYTSKRQKSRLEAKQKFSKMDNAVIKCLNLAADDSNYQEICSAYAALGKLV